MTELTLISHTLCPYVQRAAIVLSEKGVPFERVYIDLGNKPAWFRAASPLGKVPLLKIDDATYLFESAPIVEYLDETQRGSLHPDDPALRAQHRAYVEFASQTLNGIGALYSAKDKSSFDQAASALRAKFEHLDERLDPREPFFGGPDFSLVDAAFAPVFRYFDVFETFTELRIFEDLKKVSSWRNRLANRPSVKSAVTVEYGDLLLEFLRKRNSWLSELLAAHLPEEATTAAE